MQRAFTRATALLIAVAGLGLTTGCNDDTDDQLLIKELTTDNFPGGEVDDNNVADDERAFSINGQQFIDGSLKCTPNGSTGQVIVTFGTIAGDFFNEDDIDINRVAAAASIGGIRFWASHFDGQRFTTPVELLGDDIDINQQPDFQSVVVAFFNTVNFNESDDQGFNADVRARNGDAAIFWRRSDFTVVIDDGEDDAGQNQRLYYTYFDRSLRNDQREIDNVRGVNETFRNGFSEQGIIIDLGLDEGATGTDPTAENVNAFGVISDGLCGTALWATGFNDFEFGETVTHIVVFGTQIDDAEDTDADDLEDNGTDAKLFTNILDLSTGIFEGANDENTVGLAGAQGDNGAALTRVETLIDVNQLVSHNNHGFNSYTDEDAAGGGTEIDEVLVAISANVDTDGLPDLNQAEVSPGHDASDDIIDGESSQLADVFGTDDGLGQTHVFFLYDTSDTGGNLDVDDVDAFVSRVPFDASDFDIGADDQEQLSTDSVDADGGFDVTDLEVAVNRTGQFMAAIWRQGLPTATDNDNDVGLFGTIVRDGDADLVKGQAGNLVHPDTLLSSHNDGDLDGVRFAEFQEELGFFCGIQSDLEVVNALFVQNEDEGLGGNDNDELRVAAIGTDLEIDDENNDVDLGETLVENAFADNELNDDDVGAVDGGFGGNVFVFFALDTDVNGGDGERLFTAEVDAIDNVVEGPEVVSVDNDVFDLQDVVAFEVTPKPRNAIGDFPAQRIDLVFQAERGDFPTNSSAILHRSYDARQSAIANGDLFEDRFDPDLAEDPFEIDTHEHSDAFFVNASTFNNIVGVYMFQDGHAYYNEFNGNNWILENGDIEAQLIDNDSGVDIGGFGLAQVAFASQAPSFDGQRVVPAIDVKRGRGIFEVCERTCSCDTLQGGLSFFARLGGQSGEGDDVRLFVRKRN